MGDCRVYGFLPGIETAVWLAPPPHIFLVCAVGGPPFLGFTLEDFKHVPKVSKQQALFPR